MCKKILLFVFLYCFSIQLFSQEIKYKEYSYTDFFKLIEEEKDTIFKLENAKIIFNKKTDSLFLTDYVFDNNSVGKLVRVKERKKPLIINKHIRLNNIEFFGIQNSNLKWGISNITFNKSVEIKNCTGGLDFSFCSFQEKFLIKWTKKKFDYQSNISRIFIIKSEFKSQFKLFNFKSKIKVGINISESTFKDKSKEKAPFSISNNNTTFFHFVKNKIVGNARCNLEFGSENIIEFLDLSDNNFYQNQLTLALYNDIKEFSINRNKIKGKILIHLDKSISNLNKIEWNQLSEKMISYFNYGSWFNENNFGNLNLLPNPKKPFTNTNITFFEKEIILKSRKQYVEELSLKSRFYNAYKNSYDIESANKVYTSIKNLETKRFEYLYDTNPSFKTFFKWRINQFLKVFSNYGKEPERAVIFSLYVILFFAFIYLFFPNTWDTHGRKRIMDRYTFFFTYMNKKAGIHEVYLDDQKEELLEFDDFKNVVEQQGKTVPKFFTATALPLYKWAISGTKFSAAILKRFDIMKGTWNEVPKKKRIWKSFLLIITFLIAICYDILIKMLNALMLSINTFTTLGFGEIPIKGLPRYLAIIQGFIGWFMLTIFSVSLISQLLN